MSYRNLLAALVAVALTGCLMPVQSLADGVPRYPDGTLSDGGSGKSDGGGQYEPVLTRVELNQPTNGAHFYPGVTFFLQATAYDQKEAILNSGTTFQWSTSGAGSLNIADTSTPYIQVSGATQGDITIMITATRGSVVKSTHISITIDAPPLALGKIEVPNAPRSMQTNDSTTADFVAKDTNGAVVDPGEVIVDSIDSDARGTLTVNQDGSGVAFHAQANGGQATWTLVAHRRGTATTVTATGTVTVTVPTVNRIVVGTVDRPTNASACAPTQWGVQPTTSGKLTAVAVGGECAPYSGQLNWSVDPVDVINITGSGATVSWTAMAEGKATVTATATNGSTAFTASIEVSSSYPVVIQVDGSCTMSAQGPISLTTGGPAKALTLAKYKGQGQCEATENGVTWQNSNTFAASLTGTSSTVTLTAQNAGGGSVSATRTLYGTGTSIEYTVSAAPAPSFTSSTFTVSWPSAKKYSLTWPTTTPSTGVTLKLSGVSSAGKYAEEDVTGLTTKDVVAAPASDWTFTIKACNGNTTSCRTLTSAPLTATAPTAGMFGLLGTDDGVYGMRASNGSTAFLGLPTTAPVGGLTTAPRPDASGNLYGVTYVAAGEKSVPMKKSAGLTSPEFSIQSTVDIGFSLGSCFALPTYAAFPASNGSQLAFVSASQFGSCGTGDLVIMPMTGGSQFRVAVNVKSAAAAGSSLEWLGYIYGNALFVVNAANASSTTPNLLASNVSGQLLGSSNGLYALASNGVLTHYTPSANTTSSADAVALSGNFDEADIETSKLAYGLPSGELIFMLKNGKIGVAVPDAGTNGLAFSTFVYDLPAVTGVTFSLGSTVSP